MSLFKPSGHAFTGLSGLSSNFPAPVEDDSMIGEIRMWTGTTVPSADWLFCDGGTQLISTYPDLFDVIGTTYGGNGTTTFGIPDLRGRVPMHEGTGAGLSARALGDSDGDETKSIAEANLPAHNHSFNVNSGNGIADDPDGSFMANAAGADHYAFTAGTVMASGTIGNTGSGTALDVMNPFLVVNFIIKAQ